MLTVDRTRATTLDHIKPKSRGGSSLRSNLIPCCQACNHSKGSDNWLEWFQRQEFYNSVAQELIEEWISNKRFIDEELDEERIDDRTRFALQRARYEAARMSRPALEKTVIRMLKTRMEQKNGISRC